MARNGTRTGGKSFQDRELAARVRSLTLERIEQVLTKGRGPLYEAVLVKMSSSILPRLNEHTGADGGPLVVEQITGMKITKS